jgi:hypothetical protein
MSDLSLVTMDEIWKELCTRNDACIFAAVKNPTAEEEESHFFYYGGQFTAIGLASQLKEKINYKLIKDSFVQESDDNEIVG